MLTMTSWPDGLSYLLLLLSCLAPPAYMHVAFTMLTVFPFHKDLPDPNARSLMPGFHLAPTTSAVVWVVPACPVLLDGHDLGFPTKVISVMKANWSTHIPLNALSTHALLASASSSKDDAYQNVAIGDGGLRIIPPKLNEKDKPSMSVHEWLHAHPRLVACIRKYLPHYGNEVADMWEKHFAAIFA